MNPLQREHADLGRRAAWRGETTNLAACRQDPVAGDDQRHRIVRHGLTDIARSFRSGTEFLRQSAISGRAAPSDLPRRGINTLERSLIEALAGCYLGRRQVVLAERHYRARLRPFGTFRFKS